MTFQNWRRITLGLLLVSALSAQQPPEPHMPDFVPIREPRFVTAAKADFLKGDDRVVGVSENGVSKAYQPSVLAFHHVVQDSLGDLPVIITWCGLCNTPLAYKSEVDGRKLTFERAGNRGNNFFMSDAETNSHWQQIGGDCFEGPLKGKRLTMVPFLFTTWTEWLAQHPDTLVLVPEPAYKDAYASMAKRTAAIPYGSRQKPTRELVRPEDTRLANYEQVIGVEVARAAKAYPVSALVSLLKTHPMDDRLVLDDQVGATPVLLLYAASSDTAMAFSRAVAGRTLTFKYARAGNMSSGMVDEETSSTWDFYGQCVGGKLKGQKLEVVIPQPSLWFAWAEFHPDTEILVTIETTN
jgi:hypothetical protein